MNFKEDPCSHDKFTSYSKDFNLRSCVFSVTRKYEVEIGESILSGTLKHKSLEWQQRPGSGSRAFQFIDHLLTALLVLYLCPMERILATKLILRLASPKGTECTKITHFCGLYEDLRIEWSVTLFSDLGAMVLWVTRITSTLIHEDQIPHSGSLGSGMGIHQMCGGEKIIKRNMTDTNTR